LEGFVSSYDMVDVKRSVEVIRWLPFEDCGKHGKRRKLGQGLRSLVHPLFCAIADGSPRLEDDIKRTRRGFSKIYSKTGCSGAACPGLLLTGMDSPVSSGSFLVNLNSGAGHD